MSFTTIIGIDCATVAPKVGIARARREAGRWRLIDVARGWATDPPATRIASWLDEDPSALLALDAPLGWPAQLSRDLAHHWAGAAIHTPADEMFSRATDRFVKRVHGKRPLEVGAALIARTARAILLLLDELRRTTGREIPLAWSPDDTEDVGAIEVYPAVTRKVHLEAPDLAASDDPRDDTIAIIGRTLIGLESHRLADAAWDELDAALCVVAGIDFLDGSAAPPEDPELAKREGWIWVRRPDDANTRT